jgi:hypothetical protein
MTGVSDNASSVPAPDVSAITLGPWLSKLGEIDQKRVFNITWSSFKVTNQLTDAQLSPQQATDLASACESVAHAFSLFPDSPEGPSPSPNPPALTVPRSPPLSSWSTIKSLPSFDSSSNLAKLIPRAFHEAIADRFYLPLSTFTFDSIEAFRMGKTVELEKVSDVKDPKLTVRRPKTQEFAATEDSLSRSDWDGAYGNFLDLIQEVHGIAAADAWRDWYKSLREHFHYRKDDGFPIIRRFDKTVRIQWFNSQSMFALDNKLWSSLLPSIESEIRAEQFRSSLHHVPNTVSPSTSSSHSSLRSYPPSANRYNSSSSKSSYHPYERPPSFPKSSRLPGPASSCIRCGRANHTAKKCIFSSSVHGRNTLVNWRDGRLVVGSSNDAICVFWNTPGGCQNNEHEQTNMHRCSLCLRKQHGANSHTPS